MAEKEQYPNIEVSYLLRDDERSSSSLFYLAGEHYQKNRDSDEEFGTHFNYHETSTEVIYGRKVLEVMSYAEISHEADVMQSKIEENVTLLGGTTSAKNSRVGIRLFGLLPEQE